MAVSLTLDDADRVIEPEGKTREYKRDLSSPQPIVRTLIAFANSAGGELIIGIDDDRTVIGVDDPLAEQERLASLIADVIEPQLVPAMELIPLAGKTLLGVDVPLSTRRPHFLTRRGIESGTYVRLGSTNRQADGALVADLERTARGIAFEDLTEPRATLEDLDLNALSSIRGRETSIDDLSALSLVARNGGDLVPTNAGILAACPYPDRFLTSAWVQCGRIRGENRTDIFDQTEIHRVLPHAVDEVMAFVTKHAFKTAEFGGIRRRDVYSIPVEPIREVVVNALVHASYAERGTPIRVVFLDDRIQVESPGGLVSGMTVEGMRDASRLRNPSLARIFREAGLMENFGTGVRRVYQQLADAELPEPQIEEIVDRVRFTIFIQSHGPGAGGSLVVNRREAPSEQVSKSSEQVSKSSEQVSKSSERVVAVLRVAADAPQSRSELLSAIGLVDVYRNYQHHILPLLEAGHLARTIPDKPNSRLQRYITTKRGRALLDQQSTEGER